jgi:RES domain-containing protein
MRLWRLSGVPYAHVFDGGYGLSYDGRWNTMGRPVTYCSSSPALCLLEKLVHIEDPTLLPELALVAYELPDGLGIDEVPLADLPPGWRHAEASTQAVGDAWLAGGTAPLLRVPSVIVPIDGSPDRNFLVNHRHPDAGRIRIAATEPFALDTRLLRV